ncbi:MAG: hypothetical protein mread185_000372 [Mycoplasmataceae bacterium]|nr:MAG: hypothetical protein mread185_000372 [Mycoplasmataceae bacterium]
MTNNNQYYIPKLPETETVSYFDVNEWDKGLTEEQLEQQKHLDNVYESEYQHQGLTGPQYGPGNEQSREKTAKYAGKRVLSSVAGELLGPAALPIGLGLKHVSDFWDMQGQLHKIVSGATKREDILRNLKNIDLGEKSEFAKWMEELGGDLMKSGFGNSLGEFASNSSSSLGGTANIFSNIIEAYSEAKDNAELTLHILHLSLGNSYDPNCEICKEN